MLRNADINDFILNQSDLQKIYNGNTRNQNNREEYKSHASNVIAAVCFWRCCFIWYPFLITPIVVPLWRFASIAPWDSKGVFFPSVVVLAPCEISLLFRCISHRRVSLYYSIFPVIWTFAIIVIIVFLFHIQFNLFHFSCGTSKIIN